MCEPKSRIDETNNSNTKYISDVYLSKFDFSNDEERIIKIENEIVIKVLVSIKVVILHIFPMIFGGRCINYIRENI